MNVLGERVVVLSSSDPSLRGRSGTVVLETARTLVLATGQTSIRVVKAGTVFQLHGSKKVVAGADIAGRLEDRWGSRKR